MKKIILSIVVVFVSLVSMAQKPEYFQTMGETLGQYANCKDVARFSGFGQQIRNGLPMSKRPNGFLCIIMRIATS